MRFAFPFAVLAILTVACGSDAGSDRGPDPRSAADRDTALVTQRTAPARPDAAREGVAPASCDLIPHAEIERIAGPLDGEPKAEGRGCWYYVVADTTTAEWKQIREGAERARAAGMDERAIALYHPLRAGIYAEVDARSGAVFNGRTGHVRVSLKVQQLRLPPDTVVAVASRVRDRVPEGPMAHPAADRSGRTPPGRDPCSVLTRDEAEAVLGRLVADPFRARERTPLADPAGASCVYLTAGHRALVLTPVWNYGGIELSTARMVGGMVRQVADLPGIEGDTLEGAWDEAVVDLTGELLLRKGGRVLGVRYLMSSTDAAGAIRLAEPALGRMAANTGDEE
jgi:hypothetical protein